jgi:hypothetical protein
VAVDLHRWCERYEGDVDAVPVEKLEPSGKIVIAKVDGEGSFDGKLEGAVPETGPSTPAGERREKPFRPKMLVDVDCEQGA